MVPEMKAVELGDRVRLTLVKRAFSVTTNWLERVRLTELTLKLPFTCTFVRGCRATATINQ